MFSGRQAKHLERQQFKGAQQFSAAIEQQGGVGSGEVHENFRFFPITILLQRGIDHDPILKAKPAVGDDGLQELVNLFGGSDFVGNGHE